MQPLNLKPTHKLVKNYYQALGQFGQLNIDHEMAVRSAFQNLLAGCGHQFKWILVPEYQFHPAKLSAVRIDGALLDTFRLPRGYWEAKDEHDDLDKEIRAKLDKGYPRTNIIFQAPERAVLYQHGVRQGLNEDIRDSANLVELLKTFFGYREPHYEEWDAAVADFKDYIPQIAGAVKDKIENQRRTNPAFVQRFDAFYDLCRQSINPNLSVAAVEEMLIQHLMTERIFRRIFDNSDFTRRNVIAVEIEKIIDSMTAREFSRDAFLKDLDRFYRAIELAAENTETYKQKQDFINTVYERFFQGYSPKEADTHGIVYTPQPIVDFMVRSVEDILKKEFGRSLSHKDVHILDPFVGTGNFITRVMKEIKTSALPYKYENELHCNEVMLLPYYVASMNIEHEYLERTGEYKAFPGICLVDTFELAEPEQSKLSFMTEENTARVKRQKESPIFVIIANPPYNVGQLNENDNNKNRKYDHLDRLVADTFARESKAVNKNALSDVYVKAFRWACDRLGEEGIIAFVSNNGFVDGVAFDGMRHILHNTFESIYHLDLKGNARTAGERRRREAGNVFDDAIRVGVGITLLVKRRATERRSIYVHSVADYLSSETKRRLLENYGDRSFVPWIEVNPDKSRNWVNASGTNEWPTFCPMSEIFGLHSRGLASSRDAWAYNSDRALLERNIRKSVDFYNAELKRWKGRGQRDSAKLDDFLVYDDSKLSWTRDLKGDLQRGRFAEFSTQKVRRALYRPYTSQYVFFDRVLNEEVYRLPKLFPLDETANSAIVVSDIAYRSSFAALASHFIPDFHLCAPIDTFQCFPFYTYDEDGSNRRENITDWALNEFRTHYSDPNITKWDIFHYVYAVLHHPEYRERYAANLKRELPRIPFVTGTADPSPPPPNDGGSARDDNPRNLGGSRGYPLPNALRSSPGSGDWVGNEASPQPGSPLRADFARDGVEEGETNIAQGVSPGSAWINEPESLQGRHILEAGPSTRADALARDDKPIFWAFANAGGRLADLHVNYEQQPEYPLERIEKGQLNWRVEKMRLGKDKTSLIYNEFLTLRGIPPQTYEYRLGNRSALEWVVDQYQVSTDKRSGIVNDPNRADDPGYIVRLIGQVIGVSLETMKIVKSLPPLVADSIPL